MTQLTISIPESAQAYINEQIASGQYSSPDLLLTDLIEQAQERQAKLKLNTLLKTTLQKNEPPIEATDEWWEQQREQLIQKHNIPQV